MLATIHALILKTSSPLAGVEHALQNSRNKFRQHLPRGNKHPAATHRKTPFTYLNRGRQSLLLVAGKVSCKLLGVLGLEEVHRASDGISEPIVDEVHRRAGCDRAIRAWQPIREKDPPRAALLWLRAR